MSDDTDMKDILDAVNRLMTGAGLLSLAGLLSFDVKDGVKKLLEEFLAQQWVQWHHFEEDSIFEYKVLPIGGLDFQSLLEYAGLAEERVRSSDGKTVLVKPDGNPLGFVIGLVPLFDEYLGDGEYHFYDCLINSETSEVLELLYDMHRALLEDRESQ